MFNEKSLQHLLDYHSREKEIQNQSYFKWQTIVKSLFEDLVILMMLKLK